VHDVSLLQHRDPLIGVLSYIAQVSRRIWSLTSSLLSTLERNVPRTP
jgi:hypothetical protein